MMKSQLMKYRSLLLVTCFAMLAFQPAIAQNMEEDNHSNIIKLNLTSLPLKNISLQYERILSKKFAAALSFRTMPKSTLPFKNAFANSIGDGDADIEAAIRMLKVSNIAITPEFRWYVGKKGYGRGFYIAPFYRYSHYQVSDIVVNYETTLSGPGSVSLSGDLNTHTGGLLFGAQWLLGKRIMLDWWILGPHYGAGNGSFSGVSSRPLNALEQNEVRNELENYDIPLTNKKVTVNSSGAVVDLSGPWGGVRAGISVGMDSATALMEGPLGNVREW
ncbi:MAG: DUF3575 domain-containing protein [Pedobacter sp.]|nr:MAG: DUF3575 domain-containing protein [Pedobacter sp.]